MEYLSIVVVHILIPVLLIIILGEKVYRNKINTLYWFNKIIY